MRCLPKENAYSARFGVSTSASSYILEPQRQPRMAHESLH